MDESHTFAALSEGPQPGVQHERSWQLRRQRARQGFFGMLKQERVNRRHYYTRTDARAVIFDYIERFYNPSVRRRLVNSRPIKTCLTQLSGKKGLTQTA